MTELRVSKIHIQVHQHETITSGGQNVFRARFTFDHPDWAGLTRTAVFRAGDKSVEMLLDGSGECVIPWEVLESPDQYLYAGVYGTKGEDVVLPTVWASLGLILPGTQPGEGPGESSPSAYQQLLSRLEQLGQPDYAPSDYAQNDPKGAGYIKNRPAWFEDGTETVILDQSIPVGAILWPGSEGLIPGADYALTINGRTDIQTAYSSTIEGMDFVNLGDDIVRVEMDETYSVAGYAIAYIDLPPEELGGINALVAPTGDGSVFMEKFGLTEADLEGIDPDVGLPVKLACIVRTAHKMDYRLLPDELPAVLAGGSSQTALENIPAATAFGAVIPGQVMAREGDRCEVIFGGARRDFTAYAVQEDGLSAVCFGDDLLSVTDGGPIRYGFITLCAINEGQVFYLSEMIDPDAMLRTFGLSAVSDEWIEAATLSLIIHHEHIRRLDRRFLPEGLESELVPLIGENGNWFQRGVDTGLPSRGPDGAQGKDGPAGKDGKSAYQYAVEGGYTGTEGEFAAHLVPRKFPVDPQIDLTISEETKQYTITELNGIPLADYGYTALRVYLENAGDGTGTASELQVRFNRRWDDSYDSTTGQTVSPPYIAAPTGFVNAASKLYWGGGMDLDNAFFWGLSSAVANPIWRSDIMSQSDPVLHGLHRIFRSVEVASVLTTIPVGTKIKIWLK